MISKANTHGDGARLAAYMTTGKVNEDAELWQLRGFGMGDIIDAFRTVHVMADATNCEKPFFHVQVRNRDGENLTRQQWEHTADRIEGILGLKDQPRAIAFHIDQKSSHEHMHIAYSRIDEDTMTARPLPFFKERLKKISRELEMQFALEPVKNQRDRDTKSSPTGDEHEQARRLGQDVHELQNSIRECWDRSDCGRSFQSALEHEGFTLALGDRRGFVAIDRARGLHVLSKRILDVSAAKIRDRLSDLSDDLPSVATARAFVQEAKQEQPEPGWDRDRDDQAWQNSVINAAIEGDHVEQKKSNVAVAQPQKSLGNRKKEGLIQSPTPEMIGTAPVQQFKEAAQAIVEHAPASGPEPMLCHAMPAEETADDAGAPAAIKQVLFKPDQKREIRIGRSKNRSLGIYRKALDLPGILRQQFRQLASFLTGHATDPERALKRGTSTTGGSAARQRHNRIVPPEPTTVVEFLSETLDWLNLWHHDAGFNYDSDDDFHPSSHDHFYPQP